MNLIEAKITAMIALGLGSLATGLLPSLFTRFSRKKYPLFLSMLLCFGAGVLLSTAMIHLLPEVRELLEDWAGYAELFFCGGFFILYCIDEIAHLCRRSVHGGVESENRPLLHTNRRHSVGGYSGYGTATMESSRQPSYNPNFASSQVNLLNEGTSSSSHPSQLCHIGHHKPETTKTSSFSLLIALTVHAVLEGLAVGLEESTSQVLLMLVAIASHKLVVGFCLGTELSSCEQTTACQYFSSIATFSFGSVAGIALGLTVTDLNEHIPDAITPILQGLAGGTLLYVTVSEVLPRERAQWHQIHDRKVAGSLQFVSVIVGFTVMSVLIKTLNG